MFFAGSRYLSLQPYVVTTPNGQSVTAIPVYQSPSQSSGLLGYYRRKQGQRLDQIADFYLADATTFWKLCDANTTVVPDSLGNADLVGIPKG